MVTFDFMVDYTDTTQFFVCNKLFVFHGANSSSCVWASQLTVVISPAVIDNIGIVPGDVLKIRPGVLRAACTAQYDPLICSKWKKNLVSDCRIEAPGDPIQPSVKISAPRVIGICEDLQLDFSSSPGFAGRRWKSAKIIATSAGSNTTSIRNYLGRTQGISAATAITIPSLILLPNSVYVFSLTLCNFLGACGQADYSVTVSANVTVPVVTIPGLDVRSIFRKQPLTIYSQAHYQTCRGEEYANMIYSWQLFENSSTSLILLAATSQAVEPSIFTLSPYTLAVNTLYLITVTVTVENSLLSPPASSTITVFVAPGALVAAVLGGNFRTVRMDHIGVLDGSLSVDEDVATMTGVRAGLAFSWSCIVAFSSVASQEQLCPLLFLNSTADATLEEMFFIPESSKSLDTANVSLTVTKDMRSSVTFVTLALVDSSSAVVAITTSAAALTHALSSMKIVISATVQTSQPCNASWTVVNAYVPLSAISLTPITSSITRLFQAVNVNLVIAANSLIAPGIFIFRLSCGSAASQISVSTNAPPTPGYFSVAPSAGVELLTLFSFSASVWLDDDVPLQYQVGIITFGTTFVALTDKSEVSSVTSLLPAGSSMARNIVDCVLYVFDSYGANTFTSQGVRVVSGKSNPYLSLIQSLQSATTVSSMQQSLAIATSVVNSAVDCSRAPDCQSLNRTRCAAVSNQCGPCVEGYVGSSGTGTGNSLCIGASYAFTSSSASAGRACSSQSNCAPLEDCVDYPSYCKPQSKSCSVGCALNGRCSFANSASGQAVQACTVLDPSCEAVCRCRVGFFGPTCNMTSAQLLVQQQLHESALHSLASITAQQTPTPQSVQNWAANVVVFTSNPYVLTPTAIATAQSVIASIFRGVPLTNTPVSSVGIVVGAVDSLARAMILSAASQLQRRQLLSTNTITAAYSNAGNSIQSLASSFGQIVVDQLIPGETAAQIIQSSFRIYAGLMSTSDVTGTGNVLTLSAPQTPTEILARQPNGVVFVPVPAYYIGPVQVVLTVTDASLYGNSSTTLFQTNPYNVQISGSVQQQQQQQQVQRLSNSSTDVMVVVANNAPIDLQPLENEMVASTCQRYDFSLTRHKCSRSGVIITHQCLGQHESWSFQCPTVIPEAACNNLYSSSNSSLSSSSSSLAVVADCRTYSFSELNTTCLCSFPSMNRNFSGVVDSKHRGLGATSSAASIGRLTTALHVVGVATHSTITHNKSSEAIPIIPFHLTKSFYSGWAIGCLWVGIGILAYLLNNCNRYPTTLKGQRFLLFRGSTGENIPTPKKLIHDYIRMFLPTIYSVGFKSRVEHLWTLIVKTHRAATIVVTETGFIRTMGILELLTQWMWFSFLLSLFLAAQWPQDTNQCQSYSAKLSCEHKKSFLSMKSFCTWQTVEVPLDLVSYLPARGYCHWVHTAMEDDSSTLVVLILLTMIVSVPVNMAITFLVHELLLAPSPEFGDNFMGSSASLLYEQLSASPNSDINESDNPCIRPAVAAIREGIEPSASSVRLYSTVHALPQPLILSRDLAESRARQYHIYSFKGGVAPSVEAAASQRFRDAERVLEDLFAHAAQLPIQEREPFLSKWNLQALTSPPAVDDARAVAVIRDLAAASDFADAEIAALEREPVCVVGVRILQLFVQDLLGRESSAARLFLRHSTAPVHIIITTPLCKRLVFLLLVVVNAYFMYATIERGLHKDMHWLPRWFVGSIVGFLVESLVVQLFSVIVSKVLVPALFIEQMRRAVASLHDCVGRMGRRRLAEEIDEPASFSTSNYFFVSAHVARAYPQLMESSVVLNMEEQAISSNLYAMWNVRPMDARRLIKVSAFDVRKYCVRFFVFVSCLPDPWQRLVLSATVILFLYIWLLIGRSRLSSPIFGVIVGMGIVLGLLILSLIQFLTSTNPQDQDSNLNQDHGFASRRSGKVGVVDSQSSSLQSLAADDSSIQLHARDEILVRILRQEQEDLERAQPQLTHDDLEILVEQRLRIQAGNFDALSSSSDDQSETQHQLQYRSDDSAGDVGAIDWQSYASLGQMAAGDSVSSKTKSALGSNMKSGVAYSDDNSSFSEISIRDGEWVSSSEDGDNADRGEGGGGEEVVGEFEGDKEVSTHNKSGSAGGRIELEATLDRIDDLRMNEQFRAIARGTSTARRTTQTSSTSRRNTPSGSGGGEAGAGEVLQRLGSQQRLATFRRADSARSLASRSGRAWK